jgi:hypothetical protein
MPFSCARQGPGTVKGRVAGVFHDSRLTTSRKIGAQVRGGETRQDYKDTRRFPWKLLVRSPVPTYRLLDTCPPFSLQAWRFLIAHASPGLQFGVSRSLKAGLCDTPFSRPLRLIRNYRLRSAVGRLLSRHGGLVTGLAGEV